ncbi:hypothetical protein KIN20_022661 [Parelaphostrongylus tenuis]|uniref:Uncharacterized protein n=1 Tax=Parelaphostrongylus tenuis TaxID=148309 RepID=A0AAD5QVC4_PARTN|nr:hypothetical protein KIN20_022661 [Parelaphostrongylus tenuis]
MGMDKQINNYGIHVIRSVRILGGADLIDQYMRVEKVRLSVSDDEGHGRDREVEINEAAGCRSQQMLAIG